MNTNTYRMLSFICEFMGSSMNSPMDSFLHAFIDGPIGSAKPPMGSAWPPMWLELAVRSAVGCFSVCVSLSPSLVSVSASRPVRVHAVWPATEPNSGRSCWTRGWAPRRRPPGAQGPLASTRPSQPPSTSTSLFPMAPVRNHWCRCIATCHPSLRGSTLHPLLPRFDVGRMQRVKHNRGLRHSCGLRVRGQSAKTMDRRRRRPNNEAHGKRLCP